MTAWKVPVTMLVVLFCAKPPLWKGPGDPLQALARAYEDLAVARVHE
jgi:hypothetical protein